MKNRNYFPIGAYLRLGLALVVGALSGLATLSVASAEEKPGVDARADEILKRMGDYLGEAKFFSVNAEVWQDVDLSSGQRVQAGRTIDLQVRRPNRLRAEVHSTRRNRELVYDGKDITLFNVTLPEIRYRQSLR